MKLSRLWVALALLGCLSRAYETPEGHAALVTDVAELTASPLEGVSAFSTATGDDSKGDVDQEKKGTRSMLSERPERELEAQEDSTEVTTAEVTLPVTGVAASETAQARMEAFSEEKENKTDIHTRYPDSKSSPSMHVYSPTPEDVDELDIPEGHFLTFEEWRRKIREADEGRKKSREGDEKRKPESGNNATQSASSSSSSSSSSHASPPAPSAALPGGKEPLKPSTSPTHNESSPVAPQEPLDDVGTNTATDPLVQLQGRSNFALSDCTASIHRASHGIKGAGNILNEKKDRYLLAPCSEDPKFVELELCDEIRIDHIVLANFEFFSSNFKDFTIHASRVYPAKGDDWVSLGVFRARNARGYQVFTPDYSAHNADFFQYLRIDFLSHYGSEYYCPISLFRVYGVTQMDAYRQLEMGYEEGEELAKGEEEEAEEGEEEVEKKMEEREAGSDESAEFSVDIEKILLAPERVATVSVPENDTEEAEDEVVVASPRMVSEAVVSVSESPKNTSGGVSGHPTAVLDTSLPTTPPSKYVTSTSLTVSSLEPSPPVQSVYDYNNTTANTTYTAKDSPNNATIAPQNATAQNATAQNATESQTAATASSRPSVQKLPPVHPGESIYGTIMKRIVALERNQSLVLSYIESQGERARQMLSEGDGRLKRSEKDLKELKEAVLTLTGLTGRMVEENAEERARTKKLTATFFVISLIETVALTFLFLFVFVQKGSSAVQMVLPNERRAKTRRAGGGVNVEQSVSAHDSPRDLSGLRRDIPEFRRVRLGTPTSSLRGPKLYRINSSASSISSLSLRREDNNDDWVDDDENTFTPRKLSSRPKSALGLSFGRRSPTGHLTEHIGEEVKMQRTSPLAERKPLLIDTSFGSPSRNGTARNRHWKVKAASMIRNFSDPARGERVEVKKEEEEVVLGKSSGVAL